MSSEKSSTVRKVIEPLIIVVGLLLTIRLIWMGLASFHQPEAESMDVFRSRLQRAAQMEREMWEKNWRESGAPPPPGGFDAAWKQAMRQSAGREEARLPETRP